MQSTQRYGTLPYVSGLPYTPPLPSTAPLPYAAYTAPLPSTAPLPYAAMSAMSVSPPFPMGYYGQGNQFPLMPNPNWMMSLREQMLQQQLLQERQQFEAWRASQAQPQPQPPISSSGLPIKVGDDVEITAGRSASAKRARPEDQATDKAKRARSALTSRRSPSPKRDYPRGTCTATRPSQASPKRAEHTLAPAQDLEAFKADMTSMLSDMLQSSLSKFAFQFNSSSGGQGDSAITQTVASVPTVDVASDCEDIPPCPEDQSDGEIVDSEGDPADAGIPMLDSPKMTEEEQRDYDAFSLASVSVPKRPWRAQEDLNVSKPQPQNISLTRQARPVTSQAVAKAQSVKSAQSDQRSVQLRSSVQDQPMNQAQFPVLVSQAQGQGHNRQGLGRPVVVRRDDIDSLFNEEEFSIDVDNEAVLREKQAHSEALDRVAEFCNLDRQDPQIQKEVMGMRLPAYNGPAKKSIEISLPWHSCTIPIADMNHDIVRGKLNKSLKPQNAAKPWSPKDFFGGSGYYTHNTLAVLLNRNL